MSLPTITLEEQAIRVPDPSPALWPDAPVARGTGVWRPPGMGLVLDARARRLLERRRPGRAVLISVTRLPGHGCPMAALTVAWCRGAAAEHDPGLVCLDVRQGVPFYADRRVAAYARWHPLPLTSWALGWWRRLAVDREIVVWHELLCWEESHPGLCGRRERERW